MSMRMEAVEVAARYRRLGKAWSLPTNWARSRDEAVREVGVYGQRFNDIQFVHHHPAQAVNETVCLVAKRNPVSRRSPVRPAVEVVVVVFRRVGRRVVDEADEYPIVVSCCHASGWRRSSSRAQMGGRSYPAHRRKRRTPLRIVEVFRIEQLPR
jgi:hypothetical protein